MGKNNYYKGIGNVTIHTTEHYKGIGNVTIHTTEHDIVLNQGIIFDYLKSGKFSPMLNLN